MTVVLTFLRQLSRIMVFRAPDVSVLFVYRLVLRLFERNIALVVHSLDTKPHNGLGAYHVRLADGRLVAFFMLLPAQVLCVFDQQ